MNVWTMAATAGAIHLVFVFFKAFQQRNVAFMHYGWVVPVSYCMSTSEVVVMSLIAVQAVHRESWWDMVPAIICLGTGGAVGAIGAMWLHHKYVGVKHESKET